jgi:hypothetical protein
LLHGNFLQPIASIGLRRNEREPNNILYTSFQL